MFYELAKEYLSDRGKHLEGLLTAEEIAKVGMLVMLTEEGEPSHEETEGWNKMRYHAIQKAFGELSCRRGEVLHEEDETTFISWEVTGEIFWSWVKDKLKKDLGI